MDDIEHRTRTMQQDVLLLVTAGISLTNGMHFSPYFEPAFVLLRPFLAGTPLGSPIVSLYLTSMFVSLMTLLIAGVPAALYERLKGGGQTSPISIGIWCVGTAIAAIPAVMAALGLQ